MANTPLQDVCLDIANVLEAAARRIRREAKNNRETLGTETANEIRSLFNNLRLDLLVKYGQYKND